jgi:hypothetical protein
MDFWTLILLLSLGGGISVAFGSNSSSSSSIDDIDPEELVEAIISNEEAMELFMEKIEERQEEKHAQKLLLEEAALKLLEDGKFAGEIMDRHLQNLPDRK